VSNIVNSVNSCLQIVHCRTQFCPPISDGSLVVYPGGVFNYYGNTAQQRTGSVSSVPGSRTWVISDKPLPTGALIHIYVYASNVGAATCSPQLQSTYLQIWRPVPNTNSVFTLVWQRRVQIQSYNTSIGQLYTVWYLFGMNTLNSILRDIERCVDI